ncbi:ABC transporter permease [Cohnella fermenti]|uniref:ABC transporter permease n=1 Tax=Cohnella fermenti TaxID=2565925 RepID=UPI001E425D23|nr:ABC transporter permease [Cohnella fermenti]
MSTILRLWANRQLIYSFTKRDIQQRYKSSFLGLMWSFVTPLFMLAIYTFFFSVVFHSRWGAEDGNKFQFAIFLFCGLTVFQLFSDVVNRSPAIIVANTNYVKKVVFPIEILPITLVGSALFNMAINVVLILVSVLFGYGSIPWTLVFLPIILLPLLLISLGLSWFLASLGVYVRDVMQFVGLAMQALMFLSPVFYPVSVIPVKLHIIYKLNPLTSIIENMRSILIVGEQPDWGMVGISTGIGIAISVLGYVWFRKLRGGFADVL